MKPGRSSVRRTLAAALAFVLLFAWVTPAFAELDDPPSGTSTTNPNAGDEGWWRENWGNSLYPEWTIGSPPVSPDPLKTLGFLYRFDRLAEDTPLPGDDYVDLSATPAGTMLTHVWDLAGIYDNLAARGEADYTLRPGEVIHDPREGIWHVHMRFYNNIQYASRSWVQTFGVDFTPPRPVEGFTSGVTRPTETSRRVYKWADLNYDDLSGVAWFHVYLNGEDVGRVWNKPWLPKTVTIEDIPPGKNVVGMRAEDKATNLSPLVTRTEIVDPDVPSLSVNSPKQWAWLNGTQTFSVASTDSAGNPNVTFKIDGYTKAVQSKPPYSISVNTKLLSAGSHTLTVTSRDLFGHSRTATRSFQVDNSPVRISSVTAFPNPFYPVLRDGYKDTVSMRAYLSEAPTDVFLQVLDDAGNEVREYHRTGVGAGTVTMSWDGKGSDGIVNTGTFWYRFVTKDRANNWTIGGLMPVVIRDYEIVRIGPGRVKIVPR